VIGQYIRPKLSNWLVEIPGFAAECIPHEHEDSIMHTESELMQLVVSL